MKRNIFIVFLAFSLTGVFFSRIAFSRESGETAEEVFEEPQIQPPIETAEPEEPVIEKTSPPNSDVKKLKLLKKIGAIERKIDKKKFKLDKTVTSIEKKISKLQTKVSKFESKLSFITKESKKKKIMVKIDKVRKMISEQEAHTSRIQKKIRTKIERMEQNISKLEPY